MLTKTVTTRLARSYAFRSQVLYKRLLAVWPPRRLVNERGHLDLPLLTMTGRWHFQMLQCCLFSISLFWSKLPRLKVVSDGSISTKVIARKLRWWPEPVEVVNWTKYCAHGLRRKRPELLSFCEKHVLARKLLILACQAEMGPVLWCDSDILFYGDFVTWLPTRLPAKTFVYCTEEAQEGGYDPALLKAGLAYLTERSLVNTGIVLCSGNFYDECKLAPLVQAGLAKCYGVTEQTILAHAVHETGEVRWPVDVIEIIGTDQYKLTPVGAIGGGVGRHYYSGFSQHMFWRDAIGMRLGLFSKGLRC